MLAQFNLGALYEHGRGVEKDLTEAAKWYRKAAEQGNALAQYYLGTFYANGTGVEKNLPEATAWYRKAAAQGVPQAQTALQKISKQIKSMPSWLAIFILPAALDIIRQ